MRVIAPVEITDAMLIAHNVAEPAAGETAWSAAGVYAVGSLAIRATTHRVYRRLVAGTTATPPENDLTAVSPALPNWEELSGTNRWAVFDQVTNSVSTRASPLDVTIAPGIVNALALIGLSGASVTITMTDGAAGPTVYSRTVDLSLSIVPDWYAYFFEPFRQRGSVTLTDLPPFINGRVRVEITGSADVACGGIITGTLYTLGATQYGATAGIRDYSRKEVDAATGLISLEQRRFSKTLRARLQIPTGGVNAAHTLLTELRGRACVWLGDNGSDLEPLQVFGFYRDMSLDVSFPGVSHYTLDIEGMT